MPNMTLLPSGSSSVSGDWIPVGETTAHEALASNDDGTSYVKCDDNNETMIIEFANPSVAEGDIDTINSVQFLSLGKSAHRTDPSVVSMSFEAPAGVAAYPELCSYNPHRTNWETINGGIRTASDGVGGTAWTYSDLENLEMRCTKSLTVEVHLSFLALKVSYTEAVADNATFFGANF